MAFWLWEVVMVDHWLGGSAQLRSTMRRENIPAMNTVTCCALSCLSRCDVETVAWEEARRHSRIQSSVQKQNWYHGIESIEWFSKVLNGQALSITTNAVFSQGSSKKIGLIFRFLGLAAKDLKELSWIVSAPIDEPAKVKGTKLIVWGLKFTTRRCRSCQDRKANVYQDLEVHAVSHAFQRHQDFHPLLVLLPMEVLSPSAMSWLLPKRSCRLRPLKNFPPLLARTFRLFPTALNVQMKWN